MTTALQPTGLMCELLAFPERTKIQNAKPHFSWVVNDTATNAYQEAYQILVASDLDKLAQDEGDLWDSGKPDPGRVWRSQPESLNVVYDGQALQSHTTYHWKVRTWNGVTNVSPWSEPQTFHTGEWVAGHTTPHYPLETTEVAPVRFVHLSADHVFVDFGRAAFGTIKIAVDSPKDAEVEVHLGEVPDGSYAINRVPGGSRRYQKILLQVKKGKQTYQLEIPTDPRNTGALAILMPEDSFEVYPFRYCEIIGCPTRLTRDDVRQVTVHYPFDDQAASFTSSSRVLNDVWDMCHYTMKATSFCGYYVDGDRERIPYEADAYINQLGHYGCDREFTLARRTHEYLITTPTWPTEWHLYSVLMAWHDYVYTGNVASVAHYYDDLAAKTLHGLAREDGLITLENLTDEVREAIHFTGKTAAHFKSGIRDIVDWPQVERDGYDMCSVNSVVNALHHRALVCLAQFAEALGKGADVKRYRERAARVKKAFGDTLMDPVTGLVLDGEGSVHSALHANIFALACGVVPDENLSRVVAFVKSRGMACSVYVSQIMLEALYAAGAGDDALALLTATGERSWAHMIYDVGTTIALEAWDNRLKPNQDWNHAWGAAPAGLIPTGLMGIRPLKPGFEKVLIHPQPGSLSWADIVTPTVRGSVCVRFNHEPGRSFHLEIELPSNTSARVVLPVMDNDDPAVIVDGHRVMGVKEKDGIVVDHIGSGRHTFERFAG